MMADQLADAMAAVARRLHEAPAVQETWHAVADAVQSTVAGVDHAGVSITKRRGQIETSPASDGVVPQLDAVQYELDEGPCLDASVVALGR